jgi:hypothetical protein
MALKPKAPKAPDPTKTAQAQAQYNTQAAQDTINMNALDRSGPFGSVNFQRDANGNVTGQTASLNPGLTGAANTGSNAFASQVGNINTGPINWDNTSAPAIAQQNMDAYRALTAPQRQQQQDQLNETLTNRGLPVGSEIWDNQWNNLNQGFNTADLNAAATAWNAVPGMQAQLTQNQIAQYNQPITSAAGTLGLLSGLGNLAGYAPQPSANIAAPNYSSLVQNDYNNQMQQYNSQMSGLGSLASAGLGLLTAPLTGPVGLSNSLLGMGASKLFNG